MDVPGLSLFQGAESIKLDNDQKRVEEEEENAALLRRNEELNIELQTAFGDLDNDSEDDDDDDDDDDGDNDRVDDDDVNGINKQANAMNHRNIPPTTTATNNLFNGFDMNHVPNNHVPNNHEMINENMRLKNVLASKNEELRNGANERVKLQFKIDELNKRLAIAEAEKERSNMSRQQTHELFVESKQKLAERDEQIAELNAKVNSLDTRNLDLLTELERCKALLTDYQHKFHMVERNISTEKHTDAIVKQITDRNAAQVDMMQQQINTMRTKLEDREGELKRLVIQNNELSKSRESILMDKAETINQLTKRLDDAQRQCQELLLKRGASEELVQENLRLLNKISALEQQTRDLQNSINNLTMQLESTSTGLEQLTETAICNIDTGYDSQTMNGLLETPLIRKAVSQPRLAISSTPMIVEERLALLKQEFNRCVADLKSKRNEIDKLKTELAAKNQQIGQLRADENQQLIELTMSRENAERLAIRLKNMERELEEYRNKTLQCNQQTMTMTTTKDENELATKLQQLELDYKNCRANCDHLNETIRMLEDERDNADEKYREACKDIAELQQKLSQQQANGCMECEKEKFLASEAKQEVIRLKELYIKINDEKEEVMRKLRQIEAHDLNKEILEQRNMVASLERSLQLAEMKYTEINKILEREKDEHVNEIQNLRAKYEKEISHIETKEQKDISNSCRKCIDLATKIAKLEIENLQHQTSCAGYLKDIHELKKTIKKNEQTIIDLTDKLVLAGSAKAEHDRLLDDLKSKAKEFEEFMRNQSPTKSALLDSVIGMPKKNCGIDKQTSTEIIESPRSSSANSSITGVDRSAEKRIREELARAMSRKAKEIEDEYKQQLQQYEQREDHFKSELEHLQVAIKERDIDISNLKKCIIKERDELKFIIEENATKSLQYDEANKRIEMLRNDLNECKKQFHLERESSNKLMNEWKAELQSFAEREQNLTEKIHQMEMDHSATVQSLNEKYAAAKKTAHNYKQYSIDKEKHIERESERIQEAYDLAVKNMKENMKASIKEYEKQANKRIAEMQTQIDALRQKH